MSKQIGQALIDRGLLSPRQLDHALRLQLIFGGQLGTCLVELGYVQEAALAQTLSELLGMKCARAELLQEIPAEVIAALPRHEVQRRRVVPIGIRRDALHVAVTRARSVRGLSARTGYRIVPYLAPEIYILRAMERYYGIPRRRRYLEVGYASLAVQPPPAEQADGAEVARCAEPPSGDRDPVAPRLGAHSRRLSEIRSHGELGEVILDFADERMERSILFHAEQEQVGIANWRGLRLASEKIERLRFPLSPDSIFALALDEACFLGPLPREFDCSQFYGRLGIRAPREVLVLPIYGENRLEAVLYGDGGPEGAVARPVETYRVLLDEVGVALRMLACRHQLCPA
jgi:hypothetical protein